MILSLQKTIGRLAPRHLQKGSTYLITIEEPFSFSHSIFSVKGLLRSSSMYIFWTGKTKHTVFPYNLMLYSVPKGLFSLLVCMYWPSRTSTPCHSEIFSLCPYINKQLGRIFHLGRVRRSWKANTYIRAERTRLWGQNITLDCEGRPCFLVIRARENTTHILPYYY